MTTIIELGEATELTGETVSTSVTLDFAARAKSRLRVQLDDGREAAIRLPRGSYLRPGGRLVSVDGEVVEIKAASERVSRARTADPLLLARACYHLGNRHVALQISADWLAYLHDHVLDDMVRRLGLEIAVIDAPFEPENGAYGDFAHLPGHHHGHAH